MYRIPSFVKGAAWVMLAAATVTGIVVAIASLIAPAGTTLLEVSFIGVRYQAGALAGRIGVALLGLVICSLVVWLFVCILRGRMWAYYIALGLFAWHAIMGVGLALVTGRVLQLDFLSLIYMIIFIRSYRDYREFARYRSRPQFLKE